MPVFFRLPCGTYDHINFMFDSIFVDKSTWTYLLDPLHEGFDIGSTEGLQKSIARLADFIREQLTSWVRRSLPWDAYNQY